ncbi:hypothetical protein AUJ27_02680 [Candidatus Falkowbacteria bacterium CG1_02_37_44]|uniref:Uncharacterized protein n=1 Tax=Candidatus Falkowbacteria bacterium CG1_02_37_44 TaxID=1805146 RepID=A0A1J4T7J3_9BACT|nr:MAG: hypothetical protein AUJ27_02680 [Candidatus Falkowbacteria bacterium CG1_02_37_44]
MPQQFLYEHPSNSAGRLDSASGMGLREREVPDFMAEKFKDRILEFSKSQKYKIIGRPFYNQETENEFKERLFASLKSVSS